MTHPVRRRVRPALLAAVLTALGVSAALLTPAVALPGQAAAPAPAAARPAPATALTNCPKTEVPQDGSGEYKVAVTAKIDPLTFRNGYNEQGDVWGTVTTGVTAEACGLLLVPSLQVVIQPENLVFDTSKELIQSFTDPTSPPLPVFFKAEFAPSAPATTSVTGVLPGEQVELEGSTPVGLTITNNPGDPPFTCKTVQITAPLTTRPMTTVPEGRPDGPQWTIEGKPLSGPLVGGQATVVSNDFGIPEIPAGPECPLSVLVNNKFHGSMENGELYENGVGPAPAGEGQVEGTLQITGVDLPLGPIDPVPGTDTPSRDLLVRECVPDPTKPQLGVLGSFTGGGLALSGGVAVSDIRGVFCGRAVLQPPPPDHPLAHVCAAVTAPAEGIRFDGLNTVITKIPGVRSVLSHVDVEPQSFTALVCDDEQPGPIRLATTINASAVPNVFGTSCRVGPLSAAVAGSVSGPLADAVGTATSPPLDVAAVQASGPECPSGLAANTNTILGLPTKTLTGLELTVHVGVYLPEDPAAP